jgi:hypothetical protein
MKKATCHIIAQLIQIVEEGEEEVVEEVEEEVVEEVEAHAFALK